MTPVCVGCGVELNEDELQDEGRDECGPCHERGARAADACACGLLATGADEAWDSGEHRCYRAGSLVEVWRDTEHPRTHPSPAECVGDEARAELQALAEALNQTRPIVDEVPFSLHREVRKDDGARPGRLF